MVKEMAKKIMAATTEEELEQLEFGVDGVEAMFDRGMLSYDEMDSLISLIWYKYDTM